MPALTSARGVHTMKATSNPKPTRPPTKPGDRYGRLEVLALSGTRIYPNGHGIFRLWLCRCDCGTTKSFLETQLRSGKTSSCGCYKIEVTTKHGEADNPKRTPEYRAWIHMIERCYNPTYKQYKDYGGRGISVCDRWRYDYTAFLADMGRRPSSRHSIDRYPDNNGNYGPGNCRWATRKQQQNNMRTNKILHNP